MCINSAYLIPSSAINSAIRHIRPLSKPHNRRVLWLNRVVQRRRRSRSPRNAERKEKVSLRAKLKLKNLKLHRENQSIIQANEKLRKKTLLLHQENQALLSQLQKKFPYSHKELIDKKE